MKEYIKELNLKQPFFTGLILVQNTRLVLMNIEYVKFLWHYQLELRKQFQKKNETIHWKLMNDSWKKKNMRHSQNYNWQCPNTVPILK